MPEAGRGAAHGPAGAPHRDPLIDGPPTGHDEIRAKTARAGAYALAAEAVEFCLRLGSIIVLARLLVPEHFGLIAMVTAFTSIAERFKDLGLSIATVQRSTITRAQVSTLFWVNAGVGLGITLLVAALAWPVARFYADDRLFLIMVAIASSFFWSGLAVQHQALLRRRMQYGRIALVQIASSTASVAVAVALALADFGYWALVAREVSRGLFLAVGSWICMPWKPGPPRRGTNVRSMLSFGGDVTAFNLIAFLSASFDQIIIGKLFGAAPLGLYRQGINLVLAPMTQVVYPVNSVAESALSRLQHDPDRYRRYYVRILAALSMVTMPLTAFLAVFAEEVVHVALGPSWLAAAEFFRILALAAFMRAPMATVGSVIISQGLSRRYLWWGLTGASSLVLALLLGSRWGAVGVAYAHVVWTYLWIVPCAYWGLSRSPVGMGDFAAALTRPIAASLVLAAVLSGMKYGLMPLAVAPLRLAVAALAAAPTYLGVWLLLPGGRAELARVMEQMRAVVRRDRSEQAA